ncbi:hypothetical protein VTJ83DRAFT_5634 [Remersonia thermophila]|uniref:Uncharacterized protein n=1 Tax=Remersonia thermophila TaxID=72144 RepID=A0ABR4D9K9_9PEZI
MSRSVAYVYAAALVALVAATALTIGSLLSPDWVSYTTRLPSGATVTDAIGLRYRCTTSHASSGPGPTVACTPFPEASRRGAVGGQDPSFGSMWRTAGSLVGLAVVAELAAIVGIGAAAAAGKARRASGRWKALSFVLAGVALVKVGALAVVAYLFDHDDLFLAPGYRLDSAFYLCAGGVGVTMLVAAGLAISALVLPPADGYELLKDRSGVESSGLGGFMEA